MRFCIYKVIRLLLLLLYRISMFIFKEAFFLLIYGIGIGISVKSLSKIKYENCIINASQQKLDVLPGSGWDNLENQEKGRILELNFSKCLLSNDNRYLIPNHLSIVPKKIIKKEIFSEIFDHFLNYTSKTSKSINLGGDLYFYQYQLGGSFSTENIKIKMGQLKSQSMITRSQLRYNVFQSMFEPDTPLYPTFKNRIMDIAAFIIEGKESLYPSYLADEIIRDYGTHVINSLDLGALLSKTDIINANYAQSLKNDISLISSLASASFYKIFNIKFNIQNQISEKKLNEYMNQDKITDITAIGSPYFMNNFSLPKWEESIIDNLAPIDRKGDPIYNILTQRVLPELSFETIYKLKMLLKSALIRYYSENSRKGCMDIHSQNFNPDANIDGKYCGPPVVNFTLGGVYQKCEGPTDQCSDLIQKNPLTGSFSCPKGFNSVKLHKSLNRCKDYCVRDWIFWKKCNNTCSYFETFWCYPIDREIHYNGYQLGGLLSEFEKFCPPQYFPLKFGIHIKLCVTSDSGSNNQYAMNFGGFYSCNVGNPLVHEDKENINQSNWVKGCADGYVAQIVTHNRECQISYCVESKRFSLDWKPKLRRPPFIKLTFNPKSTNISVFTSKIGKLLTKNKMGIWEVNPYENQTGNFIHPILLISIIIIILICFSIVCVRKRYLKRKNSDEFGYVKYSKTNYSKLENEL